MFLAVFWKKHVFGGFPGNSRFWRFSGKNHVFGGFPGTNRVFGGFPHRSSGAKHLLINPSADPLEDSAGSCLQALIARPWPRRSGEIPAAPLKTFFGEVLDFTLGK